MNRKRKMMMFSLLIAAVCSSVFSAEWRANVEKSVDALVSSCVVLPCTFTHPGGNLPSTRLRAIWHHKDGRDQVIYHEDNSRVLDNFKGRTRMLGDLGRNNCTLEITDVKNHDNGPFCFRVELVRNEDNEPTKDMFSFVEECVSLNILSHPPAPTLTRPKTAYQGQPYSIACSVTHTCPSHAPKLQWKVKTTGSHPSTEHQKDIRHGNWEAESILTVIPEEEDDHTEITCVAEFNGRTRTGDRVTSSQTMTLYVKRAVNYKHIIIPTVVALGTALIFGVFCVLMVRKYKKRITELQSQDGSMWNRLSRMSRRFHSGGSGPSHSAQRQSVWSRFSRRPKRDIGQTPNDADLRSDSKQKVGKPRCPSPKSQPKSCNLKGDRDDGDVYMNTADLNIYGNI